MLYFVKTSRFKGENMILIYFYPYSVTSLSFHMSLLIVTYFMKSPQMCNYINTPFCMQFKH